MKKLLFILCFHLVFSFATEAQAGGIYYSFPAQRLYFYPSYPLYRFWSEPQAFRHKKHPKGSYYAWKRNNFYYTELSQQKMLAYKAVHGEGQTINPLDDPKFLNDVKVYSLPGEAQITTTPTSNTPSIEIQSPNSNTESKNPVVK